MINNTIAYGSKVGDPGDAYLFELQYRKGGSKLRVTPPGEVARYRYKKMPSWQHRAWAGKTAWQLEDIHREGMYVCMYHVYSTSGPAQSLLLTAR